MFATGCECCLRKPGFTVIAVLALALGIGANTAIFSVVNAVMLRPLPFKEPERLVMVWEKNQSRGRTMNVINPGNFLDWRAQNTVFEQMASFYDDQYNLTGDAAQPEEVPAQIVSTNIFSLLGVNAELGRTFVDEEGQDGHEMVTILSHGLWQRRFGGDRSVIGKTVMLNGQGYTVVGVMPADFRLYVKQATRINKPAALWLPQVYTPYTKVRRGRFMSAIARLKPGVTLESAQAEMNTIGARLEQQYPETNTGWGSISSPCLSSMTGDIRAALFVLLRRGRLRPSDRVRERGEPAAVRVARRARGRSRFARRSAQAARESSTIADRKCAASRIGARSVAPGRLGVTSCSPSRRKIWWASKASP